MRPTIRRQSGPPQEMKATALIPQTHTLTPWKSADSLARARQPLPIPLHQDSNVVVTNTIFKDYDPTTGNKIINRYMIIKEIGRGVHGKVKLAKDLETDELVAIKIVDKRNRRRQMGYSLLRGNNGQHLSNADLHHHKENEQKIRREIAILKKCAHPHVVKLREVIDDPASRKIYMALEYTEGGEIVWRDEDDQPVLTEPEARSIFRDVVNGLDYLHHQGIIHRDIKPANLLLTKDHIVKISDFGVSYFNESLAGTDASHYRSHESLGQIDRELAETAGTPAFFAPELCCAGDTLTTPISEEEPTGQSLDSRQRHRITKAIDVWALGVTLYCFVFGRCPFIADTEFQLFDTIPTELLSFPDLPDASDDVKDLLHKLLTKNPTERITLEEAKRHPWVTADLEDPNVWWEESDPQRYQTVVVTDKEVKDAVTIMDRLRKSIHKLSTSLSSLTHGLSRRRAKSVSQTTTTMATPSTSTSRRISYQPIRRSQPPLAIPSPALPQKASLDHPFKSTSLAAMVPVSNTPPSPSPQQGLAHASYFPQRPQPTSLFRPISCLSDNTSCGSFHDEDAESAHTRPEMDRKASSASSSSGLNISFNRYRNGMTPCPQP